MTRLKTFTPVGGSGTPSSCVRATRLEDRDTDYHMAFAAVLQTADLDFYGGDTVFVPRGIEVGKIHDALGINHYVVPSLLVSYKESHSEDMA
jgi:hypothetical protein